MVITTYLAKLWQNVPFKVHEIAPNLDQNDKKFNPIKCMLLEDITTPGMWQWAVW
jgi:hypothetical protein